ncbi:RNA polymerase sigma factor [Aestuariivivens marinum]|uniref:RNA polymerase sigma factor n=1 Tax=Aestuariivivens marinum TaxID=2913555 RepID=UPI001F57EC4D|nr:RNA polymerase sigma-70 factor [Aestuariivivens marinum]
MSVIKKDIKLIEKHLREGDESAFKDLFQMYYDRLFGYINGYTNDSTITKDIVQDTFIKLWSNKENLVEGKSVVGLLYKIAHNIFIDNYRRDMQESKMLDDLAYRKVLQLSDNNEDVKEARIEQIMLAIENLPPRCKEIFTMSKIQGIKYAEIAETLSISIKTVEVQMGKAFSIIRNQVKKSSVFMLFINFFIGKK